MTQMHELPVTEARAALASSEMSCAEIPSLQELNGAVSFAVALYELEQDLPANLAEALPDDLREIAAGIGSPDVAVIVGTQLGDEAVTRAAYEAALQDRVRLQAAYADILRTTGWTRWSSRRRSCRRVRSATT